MTTSLYLSAIKRMEFVSVKINVQSRFFAGFQYCAGLLQIEHALFTEDVDVVHV